MAHNPNQNYDCGGAHCMNPKGQVRVLPTGGDSNAILCYSCFAHEIAWREKENRRLAKENHYKLPRWEDLRVYES